MSVNESPPTGHEDEDPPLLPAVAKTLVFGILLAAIWFTLRGRRDQAAGHPVRRPPRQKAAARPAPRTPPESVSPVEAAPPARPRPRKRRRSQPPSAFTVALGIGLILAVSWVGILYMRGHIGGDEGVDTVIDPAEQLALGRACYLGDGKAQDKIKAAIWFGRAAGQGNGEAQFLLGSMWADGDGLPQDAFEAAFWLRKAAAQDVPGAKALLEKIARKAAERPRLDAELRRDFRREVPGSLRSRGRGNGVRQNLKNRCHFLSKFTGKEMPLPRAGAGTETSARSRALSRKRERIIRSTGTARRTRRLPRAPCRESR